jgi:hypothetical protein
MKKLLRKKFLSSEMSLEVFYLRNLLTTQGLGYNRLKPGELLDKVIHLDLGTGSAQRGKGPGQEDFSLQIIEGVQALCRILHLCRGSEMRVPFVYIPEGSFLKGWRKLSCRHNLS